MTKFKLFLYKNVKRGGKGKLKLLKLGIKEGSLLTLQKLKKKSHKIINMCMSTDYNK